MSEKWESDGNIVYKLERLRGDDRNAFTVQVSVDVDAEYNADELSHRIAALPELEAKYKELAECFCNYINSVKIFEEAMRDGINVQGAVMGRIVAEDMAKAALAKAEGK